MNLEQIVRTGIADMEAHNLDKAFERFADDVVISGGSLLQPVDKQAWIAQNTALLEAIPNWKFNVRNISVQGNQVIVEAQPSGTHSGPLTLPMPGMPPIPATGKKFSFADRYIFTFSGDQVTKMVIDSPAGGGFLALLQQIGVQLPG